MRAGGATGWGRRAPRERMAAARAQVAVLQWLLGDGGGSRSRRARGRARPWRWRRRERSPFPPPRSPPPRPVSSERSVGSGARPSRTLPWGGHPGGTGPFPGVTCRLPPPCTRRAGAARPLGSARRLSETGAVGGGCRQGAPLLRQTPGAVRTGTALSLSFLRRSLLPGFPSGPGKLSASTSASREPKTAALGCCLWLPCRLRVSCLASSLPAACGTFLSAL